MASGLASRVPRVPRDSSRLLGKSRQSCPGARSRHSPRGHSWWQDGGQTHRCTPVKGAGQSPCGVGGSTGCCSCLVPGGARLLLSSRAAAHPRPTRRSSPNVESRGRLGQGRVPTLGTLVPAGPTGSAEPCHPGLGSLRPRPTPESGGRGPGHSVAASALRAWLPGTGAGCPRLLPGPLEVSQSLSQVLLANFPASVGRVHFRSLQSSTLLT